MTRSFRTFFALASVVAACALAPAGASALTIDPIGSGGFTNATDLTVSYNDAVYPLTMTTCTLDGSAVTCGSSSVLLSNISEGAHSLIVNGTGMMMMCTMWDPVNTGICMMYTPMPMPVGPATINFTVDRTAPTVAIASWPNEGSTVYDTSESVGIVASDGTVSCKIDGVAVACSDTVALSGLQPGAHQLTVTSTDQAGNTSATAVRNFFVKTAVPSIVSAPKSAKVGKSVKLTVDCPAGCTISGVLKIGSKKSKLKDVDVGAGNTTASVSLSKKLKKKAAKALKAGKKVSLVLTPSGGGLSKTVKLKK